MSRIEGHDSRRRLNALYVEQLRQRSEILTELYSRLKDRSASSADFKLLQFEAHKLAGTGATYGYPAISEAAQPLDVDFKPADRVDGETCELLRSLLQAIERVLSGASEPPPPTEMKPIAKPVVIPITTRGYRPSILIADDDLAIQSLLCELLSSFAIVQVAGTGAEVLAVTRTTRFDLVLLDHGLPDMDGLSLIGAMRKFGRSAQTIVMMLTAVRDGVEVAKLLLAGAGDYVIKPFQPESLLRRVRIALNNRTPTVLIADDDRLVREVLRSKFRDRGINVLFASNGVEAVELARAERPHLVVLDLGMPRLDGLGVLVELRADAATRDTPVIVLSARSTERDVSDALGNGATLFLPKPFLPDDAISQCASFLFPPRSGAAA